MKYLFVLLVGLSLIGCASHKASSVKVSEANARREVVRLVMQGSIERLQAMDVVIDGLNADNTNHVNDNLIHRIQGLRIGETKLQQNLLVFSQFIDQDKPFMLTYTAIKECRSDSQERTEFLTHALAQYDEGRKRNLLTEEEYVQATKCVSNLRDTDFFLQQVLDNFEHEKKANELAVTAKNERVEAARLRRQNKLENNEPSGFLKLLGVAVALKSAQNQNYNSGYVIHHEEKIVRVQPTTINILTGKVPSWTDGKGGYYHQNGPGFRDQNNVQYYRNGNIYKPVN